MDGVSHNVKDFPVVGGLFVIVFDDSFEAVGEGDKEFRTEGF